MNQPVTSLSDIDLDAWVSIGRYLRVSALAALSTTCKTLHNSINQNNSLWSLKLRQNYRYTESLSNSTIVRDWHAAHVAADTACRQFRSRQPWCKSLKRPPSCPPPSQSQVVITIPRVTKWQPPTLAVSLDQHIIWCKAQHGDSRTGHPAQSIQSFLQQESDLDSTWHNIKGRTTAEGAEAVHANKYADVCHHSDPQYGHTAFVDALIPVPTAAGIGYASGSRDKTIKLWTPFSSNNSSTSSSRSPVRAVKPLRTLRGHTGSITTLQVVADSVPSDSSSSSRIGIIDECGCNAAAAAAAAVLASASTDKTIKLWSLSALQTTSSIDACAATDSRSSGVSTLRKGSTAKLQAGRGPLLATFRGHSDSVTDLLVTTSSSSGSSKLVSSSRDSRIKMWDISGQSCITTWKMPGPCVKLLHGSLEVSNNSVITVLCNNSLTVLDPRVAEGLGGARSPAVLSVHWPSAGALRCAAAYGIMLAAGGRKGFRVWDVRLPPTDVTNSAGFLHASSCVGSTGQQQQQQQPGRQCTIYAPASSSSSSSRVLFSGQLPNNAPVDHMHLDRQRIVAASSSVKLHSEACIAVWSVPDGRRVQLLSSGLAPIRVQSVLEGSMADVGDVLDDVLEPFAAVADDADDNHDEHHDADVALDQDSGAVDSTAVTSQDVQELLQMLSDSDAAEASDIIRQHLQLQQQPGGAQVLAGHNLHLQEQQQQQHPIVADDAEDASAASSSGGSWDSDTADDDSSSRLEKLNHRDVIEPGVVAMSASGCVLATVNRLGQAVMRDFSKGLLPIDVFWKRTDRNTDGMRSSSFAEAATAVATEETQGCQRISSNQTGQEMYVTAQVFSKFWV